MAERSDREWAADVAADLLREARAEAVEEVRLRLRAEMAEALMGAVARHRRGAPEPKPERHVAPAPRSPAAAPPEGFALWLYGVLEGDAGEPAGWPGIDGHGEVRGVRRAGLCALVSDVPLPEFGAETLHASLEDIDRLAELARGHDRVLERALALGAVVPCPICTIYGSESTLDAMLEQEGDRLRATLRRLRGLAEWGVKVYLAEPAGAGERTTEPASPRGASGADYLDRKRRAREEAERGRDAIDGVVAGIHATLAEQAVAAVIERAHDRRLSGRDEEMLLNASYLIPEERLDGFRGLVTELARRHRAAGMGIELTGPWPPYHFVSESPSAA